MATRAWPWHPLHSSKMHPSPLPTNLRSVPGEGSFWIDFKSLLTFYFAVSACVFAGTRRKSSSNCITLSVLPSGNSRKAGSIFVRSPTIMTSKLSSFRYFFATAEISSLVTAVTPGRHGVEIIVRQLELHQRFQLRGHAPRRSQNPPGNRGLCISCRNRVPRPRPAACRLCLAARLGIPSGPGR